MTTTISIFVAMLLIASVSSLKLGSVQTGIGISKVMGRSLPLASGLATSAATVMVPSVAHAADGGTLAAFSTPLIVSFLTIIPFIYYTNALAPKQRKTTQIEVDEFNREVKGKRKK